MASFEVGPLAKKLPELHKEPQIERSVRRQKERTGEKLPNTPEAKIGTYLNRLEAVFQHPDEKRRQRNIELMKPLLHEQFVISRKNFPDSYFELQKKVYQERGIKVENFSKEEKNQMIEVIQEDQAKSLDNWIEYLTSEDAGYPTWFKYFVFRNITRLSQFDKARGHFKKRSKDTTAPYPDIYREALAIVADRLESLANGEIEKFRDDEEFKKYAEGKFPDFYAEEIQRTLEASLEGRENINGEWVKYSKGDMEGAETLYESLQGKGTGWCTAGKSTARTQIRQGDFHVYYTFKERGDSLPTQPRIAIRLNGDDIAEVRGILPGQELEPILQEILDEKLEAFGSKADKFKKKSADMKRMTEVHRKALEGEELNPEDLIFLYEAESPIEGFGYERDPRIAEVHSTRREHNVEDARVVFDYLDNMADKEKADRKRFGCLKSYPDQFIEGYLERIKSEKHLVGTALLLAEMSRTDLIFKYWEKFSSMDMDVFVTRVLRKTDTDKERAFLDKLIKEKNVVLTKETAGEIISQGVGEVVLWNLENFRGLDKKELLDLLITRSQGELALKAREFFSTAGVSEQEIIKKLTENRQAYLVVKHMEEFEDLDVAKEDLAYQLIANKQEEFLARNLEKFDLLSNTIALKLREKHLPEVLRSLEIFYPLDQEEFLKFSIQKLNDKNWYSYHSVAKALMGNIEKLSDASLSPEEVAFLCLEKVKEPGDTPLVEAVTKNVQKLDPEIHPKIVDFILDNHPYARPILEKLKNFRNLTNGQALRLIEAEHIPAGGVVGREDSVAHNLQSFEGLTDEVAYKLAERNLYGDAEQVANSLQLFSGLSAKTAKMLILKGHTEQVVANQNLFSDLNIEELQPLIASVESLRGVLTVHTTPDQDFGKLLKKNMAYLNSREKQEAAVNFLMESGNYDDILDNLHVLEQIDQDKLAEDLLLRGGITPLYDALTKGKLKKISLETRERIERKRWVDPLD